VCYNLYVIEGATQVLTRNLTLSRALVVIDLDDSRSIDRDISEGVVLDSDLIKVSREQDNPAREIEISAMTTFHARQYRWYTLLRSMLRARVCERENEWRTES